jgi:putative aminopeptidase FrvX
MVVQITKLHLQNALTFILKAGIVKVFFGRLFILCRGKEEVAKVDNLFIDIGCETKEQVDNMGVHVGCVITYPDEFMILNETNLFVANNHGWLYDCRSSSITKKNKTSLDCISLMVQEEVGLRGAENDYQNHQTKCCNCH